MFVGICAPAVGFGAFYFFSHVPYSDEYVLDFVHLQSWKVNSSGTVHTPTAFNGVSLKEHGNFEASQDMYFTGSW